jgi:TatD DNase family protein
LLYEPDSFIKLTKYYNIHTHLQRTEPQSLGIVSVYEQFEQVDELACCSVGFHPWYIAGYPSEMEQLTAAAALPHVVAIGECGLDKVCATEWEVQVAAFEEQVRLACRIGKPLIIHCVRAFAEVVVVLEQCNVSVPVIFHGFNRDKHIAAGLLEKGYYLSFGKALRTAHEGLAEVLRTIPADRYFLETDNAEMPIAEIYEYAAGIRETNTDTIILQVQQNFQTVFKQ